MIIVGNLENIDYCKEVSKSLKLSLSEDNHHYHSLFLTDIFFSYKIVFIYIYASTEINNANISDI